MSIVTSEAELGTLYGVAGETSLIKQLDHLSAHYRALIEASPFAVLATVGPEGLDASPRGDRPGFARIRDPQTLLLPDRRGNNRIDSLRNIVRDPRVALLFLIPGSGTTLRVNGRAVIDVDPELLATFAVDGVMPRSVLIVRIDAVYFQCARAIVRSDIWNSARHVDPATLPSPGEILAALSNERLGGPGYDSIWPARASGTMW